MELKNSFANKMVRLFAFKDIFMGDEDVLETVRSQLSATGYCDLKTISLSIEEVDCAKKVILRGVVNSYFIKQKAQSSIRKSTNGYQIKNLIEVRKFS
jgi:hypothetical protein